MTDLAGALHDNPYPGKVVLLARPHDGQLLAAYALTGRSPPSKARAIRLSRGRLVVSPCGPQPHDRLGQYIAAEADARYTVFGNGEQVSDVFARLSGGFGSLVCAGARRIGTQLTDLHPTYHCREWIGTMEPFGSAQRGAAVATTRAPTSASRP